MMIISDTSDTIFSLWLNNSFLDRLVFSTRIDRVQLNVNKLDNYMHVLVESLERYDRQLTSFL